MRRRSAADRGVMSIAGGWLSLIACALLAADVCAQTDPATLNRILDEALNRSELPQTAAYLSDRIGARLTNSPQMREAERWTQERLRAWGLENVRAEGFEFGRGWSIERASARMLEPRSRSLRAIPVAWTPGTNGALSAPVIVAPLRNERDFSEWKGKLRGKIVLVDRAGGSSEPSEPVFKRFTDEDLVKLDRLEQPRHSQVSYARRLQRAVFEEKRDAFLATEGALAWIRMSYRDGGLVTGEGFQYKVGGTPRLPGIELAAEDYRQLARLLKAGTVPTLEILSDTRFHDHDTKAYNIIAEIPGKEPGSGYVMAGAHLDSWAAADGAQDNAAGCAVVMEAARVLSKLAIRPKRSIRIALWSAEEQGLLGSMAYIERYLATRAPVSDPQIARLNPYYSWQHRWPVLPRPGYEQLTAYFNVDNGSGKFRGIYAEGNLAVIPIFQKWLEPFASSGATVVAAGRTIDTDHEFMQSIGVPGFQFIQDPLDYGSRVHHSNIDMYDHLRIDDLKQATVILASFLFNAADRAQALPRMPLPTRPSESDPFSYDDPDEARE